MKSEINFVPNDKKNREMATARINAINNYYLYYESFVKELNKLFWQRSHDFCHIFNTFVNEIFNFVFLYKKLYEDTCLADNIK